MLKARIRDYWFVAVASLSLAVGLLLDFEVLAVPGLAGGGELAARIAWAVGALIGFVLATRWLIEAIRDGEFGSDVLAMISILATALTDEWLAASVISVMLATGRALETWAAGKARKQLAALLARAPHQAHLLRDGQRSDVPIDAVVPGQQVLVLPGEVVPIDGTLSEAATLDESALTGEPMPVSRRIGEEVESGVLNAGSAFALTAIRDARSSTYSNLIRLVAKAVANSASGVRLANRWAVWFVPFALGMAALTWLITGEVDRAVAVIVAATPCPLILAIPVAIISGMSRAAAHGAIVKGGAALEQLARVKTVLLDKTGTLTHGGPAISQIEVAPGWDEGELLRLAASLEQASPHILARAICAEAETRGLRLEAATEVSEAHGSGIKGKVGGRSLSLGQPPASLPAWASRRSDLMVGCQLDGELIGVMHFDDPLRDEAAATIGQLRRLGVERVILVSGDKAASVAKVAESVGADQFFAECTPEQKLDLVASELKLAPRGVLVVGDGINDAPALAAASVGVAMGARGSTAASEAADVVIVEDSISHLAQAMAAAKAARRRALQASSVGMSLASLAMLAASLGLLNATGSAVTQEFIDAAAILWALVPAGGLAGSSSRAGRTRRAASSDRQPPADLPRL